MRMRPWQGLSRQSLRVVKSSGFCRDSQQSKGGGSWKDETEGFGFWEIHMIHP